MPGMDGFEVCKYIKAHANGRSTNVIAVTAFYTEETKDKIISLGARICLPKPLDFAELIKEIEAVV